MFEREIAEDLQKYYGTLDNCKVQKIIQYSVEGGKCLRGFIVKHLIDTISNKTLKFWQPIVSVELLHSASLIIDDLPCMDNDIQRRNKPSTFIEYGERHAILASFYLISDAFKLLHQSFREIRPILEKKYEEEKGGKFNLEKHMEMLYTMCDYWNELIGKRLIVGQFLDLREDVESLLNIKMQAYGKS